MKKLMVIVLTLFSISTILFFNTVEGLLLVMSMF